MNHRWRHGDEFSSWLYLCKSRGTDSGEFLPGLLWYKWDWDLAQSAGINKEGKESEFSFSLPSVHGLSWDLTTYNSFPQKLQQRQQKSQYIWLPCYTNQIPTHTLERAGFNVAFSYGKPRQGMQWVCLRGAVWMQHVFFTSVFTMLRFPIALATWIFSVAHPQNARHPPRQLIG